MNHIVKQPLKLIRNYHKNRILIDLTKISYYKLNNNYITFYSDKPATSGAFFFGFGFWISTNRTTVETIFWETNEAALDEFNSIQNDLNQYYNNIGLVQGVINQN
jgi:hypothetical protein